MLSYCYWQQDKKGTGKLLLFGGKSHQGGVMAQQGFEV